MGAEVLLAVSCPHAGNCLPQLQVSSGGPTSHGMGHEPHLCLWNRLQENLTTVRTRSSVFIWDKVGLDMGFASSDEILSLPLGFHLCLLFLSRLLCILVGDLGSSRVLLWRSAILSMSFWGHKNYLDSLSKTSGGSGVFFAHGTCS